MVNKPWGEIPASRKDFYKTLYRLALPVTLQSFLSSFLGLIDNIMVGQLGDVAVASVGLANQFFFVLLLMMIPISSGVSLFAAQFWGTGDMARIQKVTFLGLFLTLISSLFFFILAFFTPHFPMGWFTRDDSVIALGSSYLHIVCWGYLPVGLNFCLSAALRSTQEVKIPLYASMAGVLLNTLLNYLLIYGNWGFPRLGVPGSALATVIAHSTALGILLIVTFMRKRDYFRNLGQVFHLSRELGKRFFSQTAILIAKDLIWAVGISAYMMIYARMSTDAAASMNITNTVRELVIVVFIGVSTASHIVIGNKIGKGDLEGAYHEGRRYLRLSLILGLIVGLGLILLRTIILMPYKVSEPVATGAMNVMLVYGLFFGLYAYNQVFVMGILRPGGDNLFCALMDILAIWGIGFPLALVSGLIWKLPVEYVFALISVQEIFKSGIMIFRFRSRKWIHRVI
ncbi:MAG: MATE family efflux transporter [Spirochaetales bacterium]|nr:MATE family efflux transporter [Spirochaetales bacterium]